MKKASIISLVILTFLLTGYSLVRQKYDSAASAPMLVIMYDDAAVEDYEMVFPVHEFYGVPGVVCANSSNLNTRDILSVKQLKEMENAGWEVVNHGKYHAGLDDREVTREVNPGDTEIQISLPYRLKGNYKYVLFNKVTGQQEIVDIAGVHWEKAVKKHGYVDLKGSVRNFYPRKGTYLRLTERAATEEILKGKEELLALGFNVTNYTYSYNTYEEWSQEMVSRHHDASRSNSGGRRLWQRINKNPLNRFALYATNFETDKISDYKLNTLLNQTAQKGGITILWAHTWSDDFDVKRLKYVIQLAKKKNIKIVTLREALELY